MSNPTTTPPTKRGRRLIAALVAGTAFVLVTLFIVDTVAASRAEHRVAVAIAESPGVRFEPEVSLSGTPFLSRAGSGRFGSVTVSARGVRLVDGCTDAGDRGECHATLDARLTDAVLGDVWSVDGATPIATSSVTAETRIDSVNLGRLMGITDLYINTPAPEGQVGAGGPGDGLLERTVGIMLSGTVPLPGSPEFDDGLPPSASAYSHPKVKVSVSARVLIVDGRVRIEATGLYDGPEEHYAADVPKQFYSRVLERFSRTLPPVPMAWGATPERALSRGSDLVVAGRAPGGTVRPAQYATSARF